MNRCGVCSPSLFDNKIVTKIRHRRKGGSMLELIALLFGMLIGMVVIGWASLPAWAWILANFDICFTFVEEGTAKAVVRGKEFHKFLLQSKEMKFRERSWDIVPLRPDEQPEKRYWFERWSGARWVGLWPFFSIYNYKFKWTVAKQEEKDGKIVTTPDMRERTIGSIYIRDVVYYGKVESAETTDNTPVDVEYLLTVRVTNPYKALFRVHRWLEAVIDLTSQRGRQYIGTRSYKQLIAEEGDEQNSGFAGGIQALRGHLAKNFGVKFVYADIASVEFSRTTKKEYVEASTAAYLADAKAVAIVTEAKAEAKKIEIKGKAEANALKARMDQFQNNPDAAQATINGDVSKAMGLDKLVGAVIKGMKG